jgi:hypothetical protein
MKTGPFSKIAFDQILLRDLTRAFLPPLPEGEGARRNKTWTNAIVKKGRIFISPGPG